MRRGLLAAILLVALGGWEPMRTIDPDVERGNRAFAEGRWDDAIAAYEAAEGSGVDRDGLEYDLGTAKLKKAEETNDAALRAEALEHLDSARGAKNPEVKSRASYNRGNAHLGDGELEEAIEAYKDALRADPGFDDARLNLELALRKREKKRQQQQQGQGQGQGQQGQGQGQQQDPQQGQGQGQQGQGQGQQQDPQQGQGQGQGQQQDPQQGQGQGQGQQQDPQQGQGQADQDEQADPQQGQGSNDGSDSDSDADSQQPFDPSQRRQAPQQSPSTPAEEKMRQLQEEARRLRREQMRGRARDTSRMQSGQDW